MATIFAHALVPIAVRIGSGPGHISNRLLVASALATMAPDLDIAAFFYGIPYGDAFGHRGFTHSVAFAAIAGLVASLFAARLNSAKAACFWLVFVSMVSHPILDAFTNGGYGVAFFWPLTDDRYFMPWQPVMVSPIGIGNFFEARSLQVLLSEFYWILLPLLTVAATARIAISRKNARAKHGHF